MPTAAAAVFTTASVTKLDRSVATLAVYRCGGLVSACDSNEALPPSLLL